jgi:hypothetical protein
MLIDLFKNKVEIVNNRPTFIQEWNDEQQEKVNNSLLKLFARKILTDHRDRSTYIKDFIRLEDFFGFPYTSSSSFAMIGNTNTMFYVDEEREFNFSYVAMGKEENVYIVAQDNDGIDLILKIV